MFEAAWRKVRKRAGVNPRLTLHGFRHTLAVSLYAISHDLRLVQQMLGHRSLASTMRYLEHDDPGKLKPIIDTMWTPKGPVQ